MMAVLLSLHIGIALAGVLRFRGSRLKLLPWYLGFVAFAGITGGAVLAFGSPSHYRALWWALEFTHDALLMLLCLELLASVLPRRFVEPLGVFFCGGLALSVAFRLPDASTPSLAAVAVSGMATSGILLTAVMFFEVDWRGHGTIAAGLALLVAGTLLPSIQWLTRGISSTVLQAADLPGLVLLANFSWSDLWTRKKQSKRSFKHALRHLPDLESEAGAMPRNDPYPLEYRAR